MLARLALRHLFIDADGLSVAQGYWEASALDKYEWERRNATYHPSLCKTLKMCGPASMTQSLTCVSSWYPSVAMADVFTTIAQDDMLQDNPFGKPNLLTNLERGSLDEPTFLSPNTGYEYGAPNVWYTLPNMYVHPEEATSAQPI